MVFQNIHFFFLFIFYFCIFSVGPLPLLTLTNSSHLHRVCRLVLCHKIYASSCILKHTPVVIRERPCTGRIIKSINSWWHVSLHVGMWCCPTSQQEQFHHVELAHPCCCAVSFYMMCVKWPLLKWTSRDVPFRRILKMHVIMEILSDYGLKMNIFTLGNYQFCDFSGNWDFHKCILRRGEKHWRL